MFGRYSTLGAFAAGLAVLISAANAVAQPAEVFTAHLDTIQRNLPPSHTMRLPNRILLGEAAAFDTNELIVRVFPSTTPPRLTVSLFTCERGPFPCLVGSFMVESQISPHAQRELNRHRAMAAPITLAPDVTGYLLEGPSQNPVSSFSSIMWPQDNMIYTVSFLAHERQNILYMAASMARQAPLRQGPIQLDVRLAPTVLAGIEQL